MVAAGAVALPAEVVQPHGEAQAVAVVQVASEAQAYAVTPLVAVVQPAVEYQSADRPLRALQRRMRSLQSSRDRPVVFEHSPETEHSPAHLAELTPGHPAELPATAHLPAPLTEKPQVTG